MPIESSEIRKRKNSSQYERDPDVLDRPAVETSGFTEELVLYEARRTLKRIRHPRQDYRIREELLERFEEKIYQVGQLPDSGYRVVIDPEPHLLEDILDAAYHWCYVVGDRLRLVYMEMRGAEHPDEEFPGFPRGPLEESKGDRESLQRLLGVVLTLSLKWHPLMDTWGHTLEGMTEGVILHNLLETALPVDDWIAERQQILDAKPRRYQKVRELYDALNHLRRIARRHRPGSSHLFHYDWTEHAAYLSQYLTHG